MTYRVSIALNGERLSTILKENNNFESLDYLEKYGKKLGEIHLIRGEFEKVKDRRFFHIPCEEYFVINDLSHKIYEYLVKNEPKEINYCFCYGDFHYANIYGKIKKFLEF